MSPDDLALLARVATGFALGFILGFERELRGSAAGGRTFALVGAGSAGVTAVTARTAPQAIGGIVTGVGFIGAGIVFHREGGVSGLTTAATTFGVAAVGIVVGFGHLALGAVITALTLIVLELPHVPVLRRLDPENFRSRFARDPSLPPIREKQNGEPGD